MQRRYIMSGIYRPLHKTLLLWLEVQPFVLRNKGGSEIIGEQMLEGESGIMRKETQ